MISIDLGTIEYYDTTTNQFNYKEGGIVDFEYSLKVVYDWECKWRKPFLKGKLTDSELLDFYKMMAMTPIDEDFITDEVITILSRYITDPQTATTFSTSQNENKKPSNSKIYTAEELYAIMFMENIPIEFETRNLNRLLTIIRVISSYREKPKKMSREEIHKQNAKLNAERKKQLQSKG